MCIIFGRAIGEASSRCSAGSSLIGGIFRILAPNFVQEIGESFIAHRRWPIMGAIVTLALGALPLGHGLSGHLGTKRRVHHRTSAVKSSGAASRSAKRPRRKSGETRS